MNIHNKSNVQTVVRGIGFQDGTSVDLVDDGKRSLAVWDGHSISIVNELSRDGISYLPDQAQQAIYMPRCAELSEDPARLRSACREHFANSDWLEPEGAEFLTHFALASWFGDVLPVAPTVVLTGGTWNGITHVMKLLSCFCRRSLLISFCDTRIWNHLPLAYQPTLLICRLGGKEMANVLGSTSQRCARYLHAGELSDVPIMSVTPMQEQTQEDMSDALQVMVRPGRCALPSEEYFDELRERFQPLLMGYRLVRLQSIREAASIQRRSASPLGSTVDILTLCSDNDQTSVILSDALKNQQEDLQLERESDPRCVVAEALLGLCHDEGRTRALVGEITDATNSISEKRSNPLELSPRAVGHQLRCLGLRPERLGAVGRGLVFSQIIRTRVHRLAGELETPSATVVRPGCRDCDKCA